MSSNGDQHTPANGGSGGGEAGEAGNAAAADPNAERLALIVTDRYAEFVATEPIMQHPASQWVVLALAAMELRKSGADFEDVLRAVGRSFGVEFEGLELTDVG